ncbi:hypothetical protein D9V80_01260 [Buchnera aphidicola (Thelaxes californica)]|uniref:Uncharacterized protein n=1 Tax=Buchnera aphidicola (Thelaxes californica) TaxID=1315998 RepID=A0A4D6YAF5_9GAMM|nr:hypothetical protein [Buchnera aphidicola]QCI26787.1 hypothetical protein D9V80_01260 [Buchnera aphidicola (Thelaxes californica)]
MKQYLHDTSILIKSYKEILFLKKILICGLIKDTVYLHLGAKSTTISVEKYDSWVFHKKNCIDSVYFQFKIHTNILKKKIL